MNKTERIAVIGIGGVGGYLAGMLGKKYEKLTLVARGKRKNAIKKDGLILDSDYHGRFVIYPHEIVNDASELSEQDYIFICVKNYSLQEVCEALGSAVTDRTVVVPVMNGVDPGDRVRKYLGRGRVADALIYIVASAGSDYSIRQLGEYANVHIGTKDTTKASSDAVKKVGKLLRDAHVDCVEEENIESAIWEKYTLNCAFNMLTAFYSCNVLAIRKDPARLKEYQAILKEAVALAEKKGIKLPEDVLERHYQRLVSIQDPDATSSLKRDMSAGKKSELEAFGGYLVKEAKALGVPVPVSERIYVDLRAR